MGAIVSRLVSQHKGLAALVATGCAAGDFQDDVLREFCGVFIMVASQFTAGKWIATGTWQATWFYHGCAVIATDWLAGGPHCNPAVSLYLYALGEVNRKQFFSKSAAAFAAITCAFPFFDWVANNLSLPYLEGPVYEEHKRSLRVAIEHEFKATVALCTTIAAFSWELPVKNNYLMKMTFIAMMVRGICETYNAVGPGMNPAVAIAYAAHYRRGRYPSSINQYLAYCGAPAAGALVTAMVYAAITDRKFFGYPARALLGARRKLA
eukprot:m.449147 g.449147  ORF g.449147 m.449147 type:complete len:265 (-) comp19776_c0_seq1:209-1003(-)